SYVVYNSSVTELRKEIEQSNINKLKQAVSETNERVGEMGSMAARIAMDSRLTPYMMEHKFYGNQAINELKKYKANNSIIEELFVYYHNNENTVYSASGLYTINALQRKYHFKNWEKDRMLADLNTTETNIIAAKDVTGKDNTEKRLIVFLYPIAMNSPYPYGTVMYFVDESVLTGLIQNMFGDFQENTYIFDENNEIISSAVTDPSISREDLNKVLQGKKGIEKMKLNGKDYSVSSVKSEFNNWTFVTLMDSDQFFERVGKKKTIIIAFLASLLVAGLFIAILLGKRQYRPIKNLADMTNRKGASDADKQNTNELERIRSTVSNVFASYDHLSETIDLHKPFAKDQLLIQLLKGHLQKASEIDALFQSLHIKMYTGG